MRINEDLNLVLPIGDCYGYHTPISREVFESNYRIISATKAELMSNGVHYQIGVGPQIAALTLKDAGEAYAIERGDVDEKGNASDGGAETLLMEIKRLTTALVPGPNGYDILPIDTAIAQGKIDEEDWEETLSQLVFFTCHYALTRKKEREKAASATASILGASLTSSNISEYAISLRESTKGKDSPVVA